MPVREHQSFLPPGTFAQFKAVVLWAYDMDLITFYELPGQSR